VGGTYRFYGTFALSEEAAGSDGITFSVASSGRSVSVKAEKPGDIVTVALDLPTFDGTFDVSAKAGGSAARDWGYMLEGYLVPMPKIQYDFVELATTATWKNGKGEKLVFSPAGDSNPKGGARHMSANRLYDGVTYGSKILFTHPEWVNDGVITGEFAGVTIPAKGVFSAQLGFPAHRKTFNKGTYDEAVKVSASFIESDGTTWDFVKDAPVYFDDPTAAGYGSNPVGTNRTPIIETYLQQIAGKTGKLVIKVSAWGPAAQDWVHWPILRIYSF
jgi:hypothetical protein